MMRDRWYGLFIAAFLLAGWPNAASALDGIVFERNGENAAMLVLGETKLNPGATLFLDQSITGATGRARVTGPSGLGVRLEIISGSGLEIGPVTITVISNPPLADRGPDEAVVGDLNTPLFTLDDPASDTGASGNELNRTLEFVREWISVAEPPQNGEAGYRLRYTKWGQFHGTTPTGTITINAKPDDAAGLEYDRFLWERRPNLPSLDHCLLKVYVEKRLAGSEVQSCRGTRSGLVAGGPAPASPAQSVVHREETDGKGQMPIAGNVTISGKIEKGGDRDEFVFQTSQHGEWTIKTEMSPPGVSLSVGVYPAPNGSWLPNMGAQGKSGLVVDLPKPAKYVLRVNAAKGDMKSPSPYRVTARFVPSPDKHEPNPHAKQATPVQGTGTIIGTILPRGERDEFVFEAPHHGEWKIRIAEEPQGVKLNTGVYPAPNGSWIPNMTVAENGVLTVDLPKPGPYILRVTGAKGGMRSVRPYRLVNTFTPSPDRHEPNPVAKQATPVQGTGTIVGTILPRGERDEFVFEAPHHGEWKIRIAEEPQGVKLNTGVYPAPNGSWIPNMTVAENGVLTVDLPKPGPYILRVTGAKGGMRSVHPYRLANTFTPSPDKHEPNAQAKQATPIQGTGTIVGTILPRGERDEFVFEAPHHGEWKIRIAEEPRGVKLNTGVYPAPNGSWIPDMSAAESGVLTVDLPKPGPYILRVTGAKGGMRSVSPYRLRHTFTRSPDGYEPNGRVAEAKVVPTTGTIVGTILPRGERDEYLLDVGGSSRLHVRILSAPATLPLSLGVYKAPNGSWLPDLAPKDPAHLVVNTPSAGRYVLRVWGAKGGVRSVEPYRLSVGLR